MQGPSAARLIDSFQVQNLSCHSFSPTPPQADRDLRPSATEILERHGTPKRLAALPRPPADACTGAVLEACEEEGAPRVLPLLPPVQLTDDLQQLNERLPLPSCGWPNAPGAAASPSAAVEQLEEAEA